MSLKSHDIVIVVKLIILGNRKWSYPTLADDLFMSASGVFAGVKRAVESGLLVSNTKRPRIAAIEEFLIHGVKYAFPVKRGGLTRGLPTSYAALPLSSHLVQSTEHPPVWPYALGEVRGYEFSPLHESVPKAAETDHKLYEILALLDAIRGGRKREAEIAVSLLQEALKAKPRSKRITDSIKELMEDS